MKIILILLLTSATFVVACASGEGDPVPDEQECGPVTSVGNCFAEVEFEAGDASFHPVLR